MQVKVTVETGGVCKQIIDVLFNFNVSARHKKKKEVGSFRPLSH